MLVADDRDELLLARQFGGQRTHDVLADEMRVTRVFRIHGHGGVAGNRFRARRGDGEPSVRRFRDLHLEVIHETFLRLHFHFLVGERRLRHGAPVHHAFAAIDEAFLVKLDEHFLHAPRIFRVHREAFARPVARATELLELVDDDAAVFILPRPDALEKFLAAEIVFGFALFFLQRLFHLHLRSNAGVVGAGQPEDFLAVHARLATEDVLNRVIQDMAHVQHAGDVRRRDDDGKRGFGGLRVGGEAALLQPEVIPFVLDGLRFVSFGNFGHGQKFLATAFHR